MTEQEIFVYFYEVTEAQRHEKMPQDFKCVVNNRSRFWSQEARYSLTASLQTDVHTILNFHFLNYVFGGSPDDYVLISVLTGASYHIAEVAGTGLALGWWKQVIFRFSYKKERTCHSESFL